MRYFKMKYVIEVNLIKLWRLKSNWNDIITENCDYKRKVCLNYWFYLH